MLGDGSRSPAMPLDNDTFDILKQSCISAMATGLLTGTVAHRTVGPRGGVHPTGRDRTWESCGPHYSLGAPA